MRHQIRYDKERRIIEVNGKLIVDLSMVEDESQTILHGRNSWKDDGITINFQILENDVKPFHFEYISLSPQCFIKAVIENRIQLKGLKLSEEIDETYRSIKKSRLIDILK